MLIEMIVQFSRQLVVLVPVGKVCVLEVNFNL